MKSIAPATGQAEQIVAEGNATLGLTARRSVSVTLRPSTLDLIRALVTDAKFTYQFHAKCMELSVKAADGTEGDAMLSAQAMAATGDSSREGEKP